MQATDLISREPHAALKAAHHSDVISIVPVETPATTDNDGVDRPDARRQWVAFVEVPENPLLVRNGDSESGNSEWPDGAQKIAQIAH